MAGISSRTICVFLCPAFICVYMCPVSQIFLYGTLISVTPFAMTCIHGRHKLLNMCVFLCPAFICVHMCPARQICLSTFCGTFASINLVVDQGSHSALTWLVLLMHYFFEHADICVDTACLGRTCVLCCKVEEGFYKFLHLTHFCLPSSYALQVMHSMHRMQSSSSAKSVLPPVTGLHP